jgi:hypothetical protein
MCSVPFVPTVTQNFHSLSYLGAMVSQECSFSGIEPVEMHTLVSNSLFSFKNSAKPLCILHRSPVVQSLSISGFHLRSNSQTARLLHSSPFRYLFIPFHSAAPHFSQPFRIATWLPFVFPNAGSRLFSLF